ncbi:DUF4179 domain-containing protein [Paenibacillus radicis (ex Gao et al. 2016)]|uniref:DUF4179 domain-containing protein n=1 Tax=Paenibacillus radicis (ex Gao et al. 2016) TaxID=1737354 RepID=A0A917H583_9BACL|nr:DUF4179 domain-containing protein [Paenibacillus radicis (ex Gao et al. 2016)]GGG67808.1 hypothetical protein GCM10010918_23190 [Paenibacillus radicis (ex Gao et al. 2016)]
MDREAEKGWEEVLQALRNDREQLEQEQHEPSDEKLDAAILTGLKLGSKRSVRMKRRRFGLQMLVSAVCIFMLLTAFIRVSPAFAAILRDIPGFSGFVNLIENDTTLRSAINNEFIQPVNKSDSRNGYTLTVSGIMADDQRVVILYTGTGPGVTKNTEIKEYVIQDGDGEKIVGSIAWSHIAERKEGAAMYDTFDIVMGEGHQVPQTIHLEVNLEGQWLIVDIPVDHSRFANLKETIPLNKDFEVGGQRFTLRKAVITPLQISIDVQTDSSNVKKSNSFIKLALVDEKGRRWDTKGGFGMLDDGMTIHFQSNYFEKPKKLYLVADGLLLSERNKKFVINTDIGETLETPESRFQLKSAVSGSLTVSLLNLAEPETGYGYWFFDYGATFRDASGKIYKLLDKDGTQYSWRPTETGSDAEAYYEIPLADYVQPLTFDVYQYPGYVLEPIHIEIK